MSDAIWRSYARFVGAHQAGSVQWAAKQLSTTYAYAKELNRLGDELIDCSHSFTATVNAPDSTEFQEIKDEAANGLEQEEVDALYNLGLDSIGVAGRFDSIYNTAGGFEWLESYTRLTDTMAPFIESNKSIISNLIKGGLPGVILGDVVQIEPSTVVLNSGRWCTLWVEIPVLGSPVVPLCTLKALLANDNAGITVRQLLGVADADSDFVPELWIEFNPNLLSDTLRLQSFYGDLLIPDTEAMTVDTVPFSMAGLLKIIPSAIAPRLHGEVRQDSSFDVVANVRVTVYFDSLLAAPVDSQYTPADGRFDFQLPDTICWVEFVRAPYNDTVRGPIPVRANDSTFLCMVMRKSVSTCPIGLDGDVNFDFSITASDIIYLVNYVFKGGPPPEPCPANGDVNCSGNVTSADIIYLVAFVFKGGSPPCDICNSSPMPCD